MSNTVIQVKESKCKKCYSCVRACPTKAILIKKEDGFPQINEDRCISCGKCMRSCVYGALSYKQSKEEVKTFLRSGDKVAAVCAPSIAGEFDDITDYRKFVKMIRLLGFDYVNEMSFGVDIIARKYKILTQDEFKGKYYLTGNCPSIISLIEKFYPELIDNLTPFVTPIAASAVVVRKLYGETIKIVHISPCIAAKEEVGRYEGLSKIDATLTFQELRELFDEFKIKESAIEFSDFDPPYGYKGGLYPIAQGFVEAAGLETGLLDGNTITADGMTDSLAAVNQFLENDEMIRRNFNLFFCQGCVAGPGMSKCGNKFIKHSLVVDYTKKRVKTLDTKKWEDYLQKNLQHKELVAKFMNRKPVLIEPSSQELEAALQEITRKRGNKEINCGACGFGTCRGLAKAIAQGIATPEMCITNAQIANREIVNDMQHLTEEAANLKEKLKKQQEQLDTNSDQLRYKSEAFSVLIKNLSSGIVIADEALKVEESNLPFIEILGDDVKEIHEVIPYLVGADLKTLIPASLISQLSYLVNHDEKTINRDVEIEGKLINVSLFQLVPNRLVGAIFRNLHSAEERPEEIIHRVTEVIEENLRQVQQIGFILGEGAAKTEKMLNSIIKTYT